MVRDECNVVSALAVESNHCPAFVPSKLWLPAPTVTWSRMKNRIWLSEDRSFKPTVASSLKFLTPRKPQNEKIGFQCRELKRTSDRTYGVFVRYHLRVKTLRRRAVFAKNHTYRMSGTSQKLWSVRLSPGWCPSTCQNMLHVPRSGFGQKKTTKDLRGNQFHL